MYNKIKMLIVFCSVIAMTCSMTCNVYAKSKTYSKKQTLYFWEMADSAIMLPTTVEVFTSGTEEYTLSGTKVKYIERSVYAYAKTIVSNGYVSFRVSPIIHYDSDWNKLYSFTWKKEDAIYPAANFYYSMRNGKDVSYDKKNKNKAQWTVFVSVDDTLVPVKSLTGTIALQYAGTK